MEIKVLEETRYNRKEEVNRRKYITAEECLRPEETVAGKRKSDVQTPLAAKQISLANACIAGLRQTSLCMKAEFQNHPSRY